MQQEFRLHAWVILENHVHLIAQSPQLDRDIARFKSFTARQLLAYLNQQRAVTLLTSFNNSSWPIKQTGHGGSGKKGSAPEGQGKEWIGSLEMMRQKIDYIHQNPVKRGYIEQPEHWRYSSARDYAGVDGLLPVDKSWWG